MKAGEVFMLEYFDWDVHGVTVMRALVDFTVDAELAIWRSEQAGPLSCDNESLARRLAARGKAEEFSMLSLTVGKSQMTPEAEAREAVAKRGRAP